MKLFAPLARRVLMLSCLFVAPAFLIGCGDAATDETAPTVVTPAPADATAPDAATEPVDTTTEMP